MDVKTAIVDAEALAAKLSAIVGPLEEVASIATMFLPGPAAKALTDGLAAVKFLQTHGGTIISDVEKTIADSEALWAQFAPQVGILAAASAQATASPSAPSPAEASQTVAAPSSGGWPHAVDPNAGK